MSSVHQTALRLVVAALPPLMVACTPQVECNNYSDCAVGQICDLQNNKCVADPNAGGRNVGIPQPNDAGPGNGGGALLQLRPELPVAWIERDPRAFRGKFRKMAADPFAFYRGSAPLFYADMARLEDPWVDEATSRVWIQGDLHAENYGTYMDSAGVLVFDVNDFDEAYLGHYTWDLQRMAASLALLGFRKALSDGSIAVIRPET